MNLFNKLRDFLRGGLRNRKGGLAFIRFRDRDLALVEGRFVTTVRADANGFWTVEPEQSFIAPVDMRDWKGARMRRGDLCVLRSIHDDALIPIRDAGLSKSEVRDLYLPGPVRRKETA